MFPCKRWTGSSMLLRCLSLDYCQKSNMHSQCRSQLPIVVSSSWVVTLTGCSLKHRFSLSDRGGPAWEHGNKGPANGNPPETRSWFVTRMPAYEVPFPVPLHQTLLPLLSFSPFFSCFRSVIEWRLDGCEWGEVQSWGLTIHQLSNQVWSRKGPRVRIWFSVVQLWMIVRLGYF